MKFSLSYCVLCWFLLGVSGVQAQRRSAAFPPPVPAPAHDPTHRGGAGYPSYYQGLDGQWHQVLINGWENDRVYLAETGTSRYQAYSPGDLKRFVAAGDTVAALHDVAVPHRRFLRRSRLRLVPGAFGQQLYRGGGFQLLRYDPIRPATLTSALSSHLLLRVGSGPWQVLPTNRRRYTRQMLALLSTCPELADGLRAGQYRLRRDTAHLLEHYATWQTRQALHHPFQPTR